MASRTIPLTKGYVAIVDDGDYGYLSQFTWCALVAKNGKRVYARRDYVLEVNGWTGTGDISSGMDSAKATVAVSTKKG